MVSSKFADPVKRIKITPSSSKEYVEGRKVITLQTRSDDLAQAREYAKHIPLLGKPTDRIDAWYSGDVNIASNDIPIAQSNPGSKLYTKFDMLKSYVSLNYANLGINTEDNIAFNRKYASEAVAALSVIGSTQLTQLDIVNQPVHTTIPGFEGYDPEDPQFIAGKPDAGIIGLFLAYEIVTQLVASIPSKAHVMYQLIDWMQTRVRDVAEPEMTYLTGLLMKASVRAQFEPFATFVAQNYLDTQWMQEANALNTSVYCENDGVESNVRTIIADHAVPDFQIYAMNQETGQYEQIFNSTESDVFHAITTDDGTVYTLQGLVRSILDDLDPVSLIAFARQVATGATQDTPVEYVNRLIDKLRALAGCLSTYRVIFQSVVTALDLLEGTMQWVPWTSGIRSQPFSQRHDQMEPVRYEMVNHISSALLSGGNMVYDTNTGNWVIYVTVDKYSGSPLYDLYEGGIAIAASVRNRVVPADAPETARKIPIMFYPGRVISASGETQDRQPPVIVNRSGFTAPITLHTMTQAEALADPRTTRLLLVSHDGVQLSMPNAALATISTDVDIIGAVIEYLTASFSMCRVQSSTSNYLQVLPALLAIVPRQLSQYAALSDAYVEARNVFPKIRSGGDVAFIQGGAA